MRIHNDQVSFKMGIEAGSTSENHLSNSTHKHNQEKKLQEHLLVTHKVLDHIQLASMTKIFKQK